MVEDNEDGERKSTRPTLIAPSLPTPLRHACASKSKWTVMVPGKAPLAVTQRPLLYILSWKHEILQPRLKAT